MILEINPRNTTYEFSIVFSGRQSEEPACDCACVRVCVCLCLRLCQLSSCGIGIVCRFLTESFADREEFNLLGRTLPKSVVFRRENNSVGEVKHYWLIGGIQKSKEISVSFFTKTFLSFLFFQCRVHCQYPSLLVAMKMQSLAYRFPIS